VLAVSKTRIPERSKTENAFMICGVEGIALGLFGPEAFHGVGAGCPDSLRTNRHHRQRQDELMVLHTFPHVDRKDLGLIESEIFFSDISQLVADDDGGQDEPDGTGGARW
jgi:hypothetical protein